MKSHDENNFYVQYGCGLKAPAGWRNFDASPTLCFERLPFLGRLYTKNEARFPDNIEYGDIVKGLPVADLSCKAVYCSHVLEHLCLEDFRIALGNTYKILRPGGIFRLVLPDLELLARKYIDDPSPDAAPTFLRETLLGREKRPRGLMGFITEWLGNSRHIWMWDYKSLERELTSAGFTGVRRAQLGDSAEPLFKEVEEAGRWTGSLGVECRK